MPWSFGSGSMMSAALFGWGVIPLAIWSLLWTGLALWHSSRRGEKWWFILFLLVHTLGILEIIYLVFVAKAFSAKKTPRRQK